MLVKEIKQKFCRCSPFVNRTLLQLVKNTVPARTIVTGKQMYLDINCVEAARQRIRHVYDIFDTVCVQFSGGKDSTAALYLAKEVHEERGLGPVKTIFRDEEIISPAAEEFVTEVSNYDWVDMEWYCLPQLQEVWSMGTRELVLLWSALGIVTGKPF